MNDVAPAQSPYLEANYAPVQREVAASLEVLEGAVPPGLHGTYVRNASNPRLTPVGRYHWFDGDGMLHAVSFEDGVATYRNRFVRTKGLALEEEEGRPVYPGIMERPDWSLPDGPYKNAANTDVVFHRGELLALWWMSGDVYSVRLPDLTTVGVRDYGSLIMGMGAHPKVDPRTGELVFIGHGPMPPYLTHGVIGADGQLKHEVVVELDGPRLQHDLAITEQYTVLLDLSMRYDPERMAKGALVPRMQRELPTRIGLIPRHATEDETRWFEVSACYVYHLINAWEEGDEVVVVGCRVGDPVAGDVDNGDPGHVIPHVGALRLEPYLWQWRLNLATGEATERQLDDVIAEFPKMDDRQLGTPARWAWAARLAHDPSLHFDAVIRYDVRSGEPTTHPWPDGWYGSEVAFAPKPGSDSEEDGWVVGFVAEEATGRSEVHILDAATLEVVARLGVPVRVPTGYHCEWVPALETA